MQAKCVVVSGLFLNLQVGVGGGCLFERHTCLVFFCQLQVRESHVQVSILGQCVVGGCHLSQHFGCFGVDFCLVIGESQHIKCIPAGSRVISVQIAGECFHCLVILSEMVVSVSQNAVHLGSVLVVRIGRQVVLCYDLRLIIVLFDSVDFCYVVRYEFFVLRVVLQREEVFQGFIITLLSVADISEIVTAVLCIFGTAGT